MRDYTLQVEDCTASVRKAVPNRCQSVADKYLLVATATADEKCSLFLFVPAIVTSHVLQQMHAMSHSTVVTAALLCYTVPLTNRRLLLTTSGFLFTASYSHLIRSK